MALRLVARGLVRSAACSRSRPALSSASTAPDGISLDMYHAVSARTLDAVFETLEDMADSMPDAQIDVECAADVLNLGVGERAFVLNKQAPNLQLWLSSPVRGPLRYDFDSASARWINNRDAHPMLPALASDIRELCGEDPGFEKVEEDIASFYRKRATGQ